MIRRKTHPLESEIRRAFRRQFLRGAAAAGGALAGGALAIGGLALLGRSATMAESPSKAEDSASAPARLTRPQAARLNSGHESMGTSHAGGLALRRRALRVVR